MLYSDDNLNELKDGSEFPIGNLCFNGTIVRVNHYSYAHNFASAMAYTAFGFGPGWAIVAEGESTSPTELMLTESDWSMLSVGPDCAPE